MRFVCGTTSHTGAMQSLVGERFPNVLCSFAYAGTLARVAYAPEYLMLDSGAFTAWSLGRDVSLDAFAAWALAVRARRPDAVVVTLDRIPGRPGIPPTAAEKASAIAESLDNGDELRRRGLRISEVYHQFEPVSHLKRLMARQGPGEVLGIGTIKSESAPSRVAFLRETFRAVLRETGRDAFPRCHGLGVMGPGGMHAFPFYSVDSSGWVVWRFGVAVNRRGKAFAMDVRYATSRAASAKRLASRDTLRHLRAVEGDVTRYWGERGFAFEDLPGVGPQGEAAPTLAEIAATL